MRNEQGISKAYVSPQARGTGHGVNITKADKKPSAFDAKNKDYRTNVSLLGGMPYVSAAAPFINASNAKKGRKLATYGRSEGRRTATAVGGGLAGLGAVRALKLKGPGAVGIPIASALAGSAHGVSHATKNAINRGDIVGKSSGAFTGKHSYGVLTNDEYDHVARKARRQGAAAGGVYGAFAGALIGSRKGKKGALLGAALGAPAGGALGYGGVAAKMRDPQTRRELEREVMSEVLMRRQAAMLRSGGKPKTAIKKSLSEMSGIAKAYRRFDPEADRQRRIGLYAGTGVGGGLLLGGMAANKLKGSKVVLPKGGKKGLALLAGALASGALGAKAYKRGVEVRNQPWT